MAVLHCPYCTFAGSPVNLRWHLFEMFETRPDFESGLDLGRGDVVYPDNDAWMRDISRD